MINQEKINKIKEMQAVEQEAAVAEMQKRAAEHKEIRLLETLAVTSELEAKVKTLEADAKVMEGELKKHGKTKAYLTTAKANAQLAEKDEEIRKLKFRVTELEIELTRQLRSGV